MKSDYVFPRHTAADLPVIASGDGVWLTDTNGKRYLDACGGAAVSSLGHGNKRVLEAAKSQLDKIAYAHTSFFTSNPAEELAEKLINLAPDSLKRVYFVSGGSEAVESAIKLSRQYFLEIGQPKRAHIIARWQSYHGNTLGALAAGGNRWRRTQFEPLLTPNMHHIDECNFWRWANPGETEEAYGIRIANQLEDKILELGPDSVAAFIAEPVVGATMGAVPAVDGYFTRIRQICDTYGVLLILDEVMCGAGRTGTWFASEHDQVNPDIACVAKGFGAGIQPLGAMLCSGQIYDAIKQGSGFFQHGHTYLGHPVACAAGSAVIDEITERGLLENVATLGEKLKSALQEKFGQHPNIGDIRGRGLFIGIELVKDRDSKTPFDPSHKLAAEIKSTAMENGLLCYPMSGTVDGQNGDHILLAPPYILSEDHFDFILEKLDISITKSLNTIPGP